MPDESKLTVRADEQSAFQPLRTARLHFNKVAVYKSERSQSQSRLSYHRRNSR